MTDPFTEDDHHDDVRLHYSQAHGLTDEPSVEPVYPGDDEVDVGWHLSEFLRLFIGGARDSTEVGNRVLLLTYLSKHPEGPRNLRELGRRMGISHTEAARRVTRFEASLGAFRANQERTM